MFSDLTWKNVFAPVFAGAPSSPSPLSLRQLRMKNHQKIKALLKGRDVVNVKQWTKDWVWDTVKTSSQAVNSKIQDKTKIQISWEEKLLRWNKKHFSLFLKDFQLPKIVSDLRVHLYFLVD